MRQYTRAYFLNAKKIVLLYLLLFVSGHLNKSVSQGQEAKAKLNQQIQAPKNDSTKIKLLNRYAELALPDSAEKSLAHAREALHLARQNKNLQAQSRALRLIGLAQKNLISDYDKALQNCFDALKIAEENKLPLQEAHTLAAIASIYQEVGNQTKSLEYNMQALALYKQQENASFTINIFNQIGSVYKTLGKQSKAINYHRQALELARQQGVREKIAQSKHNLALVYKENGNYKRALSNLEATRKLWQQNGKDKALAGVYKDMGIIHRLQGNYDEALNDFGKAKEIQETKKFLPGLSATLNQMGVTYMVREAYEKAIEHLQQGLDYAIETNDKKSIQFSYENLYNCYASLGEYEQALRYKDLFIAISEFIYSEENEQKMAEMQTNYEIEKKENEIEVLRKDKQIQELALAKQKNLTWFLIIFAVLLLVIAGLAYYAYRTNKRANQALNKANADLKNLNDTKDKFFSIIGHDLKGPLNSLTSFSQLLINHTDSLSKEEIRNLARDLDQSVKNLFTLLENLLDWARSQTGNIELKPENLDLGTLIDSNKKLLEPTAENKSIQILADYPENLTIYADKNSVNTAIRNLISNAIKFTEENGKICVEAEDKGKMAEVRVKDNGVGMAPEVQNKLFQIDQKYSTTGTSNEKGTGLGLILCKDFIEKNGGSIKVESEEGKGTTFRFTLPKGNV